MNNDCALLQMPSKSSPMDCGSPTARTVHSPFSDYYSLVNHIGSGGYGTVWSCIEKTTQLLCCVKIVPDKKCRRKTWSDRYNLHVPDEVALWEPLSHPALIPLLEVFYDSDSHYWMFVMGYEEGYMDLFNFIDKNGPVSSSTAQHIARQVVHVLHFLFASGVDHRDIKDENILYNPTTHQIKLLDFGSASPLLSADQTYTSYQGTDVYLPPEYYKTKSYQAFPAAVWTVGCLVHVLISGDCPFNDTDDIKDYICLKWLDDGDELAKDFVDQCLQLDVSNRLSASALINHRWFNEPEKNPTF